jgi:ribosomal protein L40E
MEKPLNEHIKLWMGLALAALVAAALLGVSLFQAWRQETLAANERWVELLPWAYLLLAVITVWFVVSRILRIRYTRCPKCLGRMHVRAVRCRHCHSEYERSHANSWMAWDEHVFTHSDLLEGRHSSGYPLLLLVLMLLWAFAISPLLDYLFSAVGLSVLYRPVNWLAVLVFVGLWGLYALKNWRALLSVLVLSFLGVLVLESTSKAGRMISQQGLDWLSWSAVRLVGEEVERIFLQVDQWPNHAAFALGMVALYFWGGYACRGIRAFCWVRDNHWLDPEVKDTRAFEFNELTHVVSCQYCSKRMRVGQNDVGPHECPHCHEHRDGAFMSEWLWQSDDYPNVIDRVLGVRFSYFKRWFN